jgi:hypothetical protein
MKTNRFLIVPRPSDLILLAGVLGVAIAILSDLIVQQVI